MLNMECSTCEPTHPTSLLPFAAPRRVIATLVGRAFPLPLLVAALTGAGCRSMPAAPSEDDELVLDVQVHLLRSDESDALTTTLSEQGIEALFGAVNNVWAQAGIEWRVASILHEEVGNGAGVDAALRRGDPAASEMLVRAIPRGNVDARGWHVFFIGDLGGAVGGVYVPGIPAVLQPEVDPFGVPGLDGAIPRILAHELGHALSLPHVPCTPDGNLMAASCPSADRTRLDQSQIQAARAQADTGPFRGRQP